MKLIYFILAAIFLFNPIVSTIDILPDFIGYFFLMRAFIKASYIYDVAYDVYKNIRYMFIITLIKFCSIVVVQSTDETMQLVLSFAFCALECVFGIFMFTKLFDSLAYIVLRTDNENGELKVEKIKRFSIAFLIIKLLMAFLPDLTLLSFENLESNKLPLSHFRYLFIGLSVIIALIVGVVWLIKFIVFSKRIVTKGLNSSVDGVFKEQMTGRPGLLLSKNFIFAIFMIAIGAFFVIDFNINSKNILPDFIFSALTVVAFIFLIIKKRIKFNFLTSLTLLSSVLHIVFSALAFFLSRSFFENHSILSVISIPQAESEYFKIEIFTVLESLLLFVFVVSLILMFKSISENHIRENATIFSEINVEDKIKEYSDNIQGKMMFVIISTFLCSISSVIYVFFSPYKEGLMVLTMISSILFVISFIMFVLTVHDEVYDNIKYYS